MDHATSQTIYGAVYEALDAVVAQSLCLASSEAQIQRALAEFRASGRDRQATEQLEEISLALHRLSVAMRAKDGDQKGEVIERLRRSAECWMERLPIH